MVRPQGGTDYKLNQYKCEALLVVSMLLYISAFNSVAEYRRNIRRGVGSIPTGHFCSRNGKPAAEDSKPIAESVYREKMAAVAPARERVDGQQVFRGFLMRKTADTVNNLLERKV